MTQQNAEAPTVANKPSGLASTLAVPSALALLSVIAHKGGKDIKSLNQSIRQWTEDSQAARSATSTVGHSSITEGLKAVDAYTLGGANVIRQRTLGLPLPYIASRGRLVGQSLLDGYSAGGMKGALSNGVDNINASLLRPIHEQVWNKINSPGNGFISKILTPKTEAGWASAWRKANLPMPYAAEHQHYKNYMNMSPAELRNYSRYDNFNDIGRGLSLETQARLTGAKDGHISPILMDLVKNNPEEAGILKKVIQQKADKFAGHGPMGGGLAHTYYHQTAPILDAASEFAENTRNVAGVSAPVWLGVNAYTANKDNNRNTEITKVASVLPSATKEYNDNRDSKLLDKVETIANPLMVTGGAMSANSGVKRLRSPLEVGVTYSEVGDHGDGHRNPGKSIEEVLGRLKANKYPEMNISRHVRNRYSAVDPANFGKTYDAFFDTGMGVTNPWGFDEKNPNKHLGNDLRLPTPKPPSIRLGGYTGYATDIGGYGTPLMGYQWKGAGNRSIDSPQRRLAAKLGVKDNYITWGPPDLLDKNESDYVNKMMNVHHTSDTGMPAVTDAATDALKWSHEAGRAGVVADMLNSPDFSAEQKHLLSNLGDKKLMFVSGSGRGDHVGSRMVEARDYIRANNLQDKVQLAGALGGNAHLNPLTKELIDDPSILTFGRMPQKYYVGLPAVSDLHDISTGTSAAIEAVSSPAPLSVTPNWDTIKNKELREFPAMWKKQLGVSADPVIEEMTDKFKRINLDEWNPGNRKYVLRQPQVIGGQSAPNKINKLMSLTDNDYAQASQRGLTQMADNALAKSNMSKAIDKIIGKQLMAKRLVGGAKTLGGLGLMGLGVNNIIRGSRENLPAASDNKSILPGLSPTSIPSSDINFNAPTKQEYLPKIEDWVKNNPGMTAGAGGILAALGGYGAYRALRPKPKDKIRSNV